MLPASPPAERLPHLRPPPRRPVPSREPLPPRLAMSRLCLPLCFAWRCRALNLSLRFPSEQAEQLTRPCVDLQPTRSPASRDASASICSFWRRPVQPAQPVPCLPLLPIGPQPMGEQPPTAPLLCMFGPASFGLMCVFFLLLRI